MSQEAIPHTQIDHALIEEGVRLILEGIGEDPAREGLVDTPARVARAYEEMCSGMHASPDALFEKHFDVSCHDMVVVRNISFVSLCEHHLLPFYGVVHIAYEPAQQGYVCGLSKLARVVEVYARRLQIQERLTQQIADAVEKGCGAQGVYVYVDATHMCMSCRGVMQEQARTTTQAARGCFEESAKKREVQHLIFR